jgi:hypothetical protein
MDNINLLERDFNRIFARNVIPNASDRQLQDIAADIPDMVAVAQREQERRKKETRAHVVQVIEVEEN